MTSAPKGSSTSPEERRRSMVRRQISSRGVQDDRVLAALESVPREAFVPEEMREFAYEDAPLPLSSGQTISQPYIVALMTEALELEPGDRVLEIGAGSGYAAAVLAQVAAEVITVERIAGLAETARDRLERLGYDNVSVIHGDGTLGWADGAPYDAIVVAAGGPEVPDSLRRQLAVGGRMVIPVGEHRGVQRLLRVRRVAEEEYREEDLGGVRFVPLLGREGWREVSGDPPAGETEGSTPAPSHLTLAERIARSVEAFADPERADLAPILERVGDARVVLLGEATHGTSEFYRFRARLTRALIEEKGFSLVAVEADWPDAARVDEYVRHLDVPASEWTAFSRFPTWMWRNEEFRDLVEDLREHNAEAKDPTRRVSFHGLDLYSLHTSIHRILEYLEDVDPDTAEVARLRYGCLTPWQSDPSAYGYAALTGKYRSCEAPVVEMLRELLRKRLEYTERDGDRFFDAVQNARLVADAEAYYKAMYYGSVDSWNLRDRHMFETLQNLLAHRGPGSRAVVWEHNSHIGDARATQMSARGEHNVGQLSRQHFGEDAYLVGFGTDRGTVAAADGWDEPMQVMEVRPAREDSYEGLFHTTDVPAFGLPLRSPADPSVCRALMEPRLERAIGVIYRPETERQSHYFEAVLPEQFDEYIWFDVTRAVRPLRTEALEEGVPETWPFGV